MPDAIYRGPGPRKQTTAAHFLFMPCESTELSRDTSNPLRSARSYLHSFRFYAGVASQKLGGHTAVLECLAEVQRDLIDLRYIGVYLEPTKAEKRRRALPQRERARGRLMQHRTLLARHRRRRPSRERKYRLLSPSGYEGSLRCSSRVRSAEFVGTLLDARSGEGGRRRQARPWESLIKRSV